VGSEPLSGWRKIAGAAWGPPKDPQIYGMLTLDATALLELMRRARERGEHVTPTHLAGRALARALTAAPSLNVRLVGGRAVARGSIDVFFITAVAGGHDLTGVRIADVDRKSVLDVARELDARSRRLKAGDDPGFERAKRAMAALPQPILRWALRAAAWLAGERGIGIPALGIEPTPFGSAMVSSVGMLGIPTGFTPLSSMYRVPIIVLVGEISDQPVAVAGRVEVRPMLPVTATIDHRYADGAELAVALQAFRAYLEAPAEFEPDQRVSPAEAGS
jgi:pyruvate dehydrogenase E2 component (dihydrolipoamide acetyltransferase)